MRMHRSPLLLREYFGEEIDDYRARGFAERLEKGISFSPSLVEKEGERNLIPCGVDNFRRH